MTSHPSATSLPSPTPSAPPTKWAGSALFGTGIALGTLTLLSGTGLIAASAWLISMASLQPPLVVLGLAVVAVRAFAVGRAASRYAERLTSHDGALRGLSARRTAVFDHLARLGLPAPYLRRGHLLTTVVSDVDALADRQLRVHLPVITATVSGAVIIAVTALLLPAAAATLAILLLLAGTLAPLLSRRHFEDAERSAAAARGRLADIVAGSLRAHDELAILGALPAAAEAARTQIDTLAAAQRTTGPRLAGALTVGAAVQGVSLVALTAIAVVAMTNGTLAGVNIAVVSLLSLAAFEGVLALGQVGIVRSRVRGSTDRVIELMTLPSSMPIRSPLVAGPTSPGEPTLPPSLAVRLTGVSVRWPPAPPVIRDVSVALPAGGRLLITGASGSGKSTLVAALAGLIPYAGSIRFGGDEAGGLAEVALRQRCAVALQDAHIFATTLAENLAVAAPQADRAAMARACALVELTTRVAELPAGLDTRVGAGGVTLSGGERQRLALARTWLSPAPIVIYDEPVEHLDRAMAERVLGRLLDPADPRTRILISHQPVPAALVDVRLVLSGTPQM